MGVLGPHAATAVRALGEDGVGRGLALLGGAGSWGVGGLVNG
jgi:hypothetical protein